MIEDGALLNPRRTWRWACLWNELPLRRSASPTAVMAGASGFTLTVTGQGGTAGCPTKRDPILAASQT